MCQWFLSYWMTVGEELQNVLEAAVAAFETPEDSNNGMETALTKCPMKLIPTYDKILDGGPLAKYTGIATMRRRCSGFNAWVERLLTSVGLVVQHHRTICQNFLALQQVIQTIPVFAFQRAVEFLMPQMKAR